MILTRLLLVFAVCPHLTRNSPTGRWIFWRQREPSSILYRFLTRSFQRVANMSKTTATSGIVADSPFKSPNGHLPLVC